MNTENGTTECQKNQKMTRSLHKFISARLGHTMLYSATHHCGIYDKKQTEVTNITYAIMCTEYLQPQNEPKPNNPARTNSSIERG
jgi:hypothetical protein